MPSMVRPRRRHAFPFIIVLVGVVFTTVWHFVLAAAIGRFLAGLRSAVNGG